MAETTNNPHDHKHDHETNPQVSFERADVNVFQITGFGIGLVISCLVVVFAMWALFDFLAKRENAKNEPMPQAMSHPVYPRVELQQLHDDEDAILNTYGWVNPNTGTVRIPIDQAIDMVAQKGLPSKPSPAGSDNDGYRMIPADASGGRTLEKISR